MTSAPIRLLGPVTVDASNRAIDLGPAKQRAVLATLLLAAGHPLTADDLISRVWGDDPPPGARAALRAYVCRLRQTLSDTQVLRIKRSTAGYLVEFDPEELDVARFRRRVREAREAIDGHSALVGFAAALNLWRGTPLSGVNSDWLDGQRDNLHRERRVAELEYNDLALRHGEHGRILPALLQHAADEPFDERVAGQLMLALQASGRATEALAVYDRTRRRLRDELGTEPARELQDIQQRVLRAEAPTPPVKPPPTSGPSPRQLPPAVAGFVDRTAELEALDRAVLGAAEPGVAILSGTGGAGKTSLALRWARDRADSFPDGQLFVDLQGFDPERAPLSPESALHGFLLALGADPATVPIELSALTGMYRSLTAGRRLLIVADNARDSAQVRPLLPAGAGSAAIVTSRSGLPSVVADCGAQVVDVGMLDASAARALICNRLGADRLAREPASVDVLVERCAGLPLALAIVAGRAALSPQLPLAVLAAELSDDTTRLDGLHSGEAAADIRTTLAVSVAALSPSAADAFALLGLAPAPRLSLAECAALTGSTRDAVLSALRDLITARLVEQEGAGQYRMHDLIRLYAADLVRATTQAAAAIERLLRYYLNGATGSTTRGVPPATTASRGFVAKHETALTGAVDLAFADGLDELGCDLASAIEPYLGAQGCWRDVIRLATNAVAAARRLGDTERLVRAHIALGRGLIGIRDFAASTAHLDLALDLAAGLDDVTYLARAHRARARLAAHQQRPDEALHHDERVLQLSIAASDRLSEATAHNAIGWHLAHLGRAEHALAACQRGLTIFEELDDLAGQAMTRDSIGFALDLLGRHDEAQGYFRRSAQLAAESGLHVARVETLRHLEGSYLRTGQAAAAGRARRDATEALRLIGRLAAA